MALTTLLSWIASDFDNRAAAILAEAEEKAARVVAEGRETAEEEFAFRWEEVRRQREQAHRERLAKGRLALRMRILDRRRAILDGVFAAAAGELAEGDAGAYRDHLARAVAAAVTTGREAVVLNARDRAAQGRAVVDAALAECRLRGLPEGITLAAEEGGFAGGAILRDGARSVDLTLETRLTLRRAELEVVLGAKLPGGGAGR